MIERETLGMIDIATSTMAGNTTTITCDHSLRIRLLNRTYAGCNNNHTPTPTPTMFNSIRLLVSLSFTAAILHTEATNSIDGSNALVSAETILNDMNNAISTTHMVNRASPQCWMESITTMSQWGSVSGVAYCASMTAEQQKVLALELANCQLAEENRSLFLQDDDSMQVSKHESCHVGKGGSEQYEVSSCLRFMTDFALNLYHQMLLYANDVCNRLTNEMMEQQKEETTINLIKASSSFVDLTRQQQMEADLAQKALLKAIGRNELYLQEHQQQWEEANQARQMELARAEEARERAAEAREREVEAREKAALLAMQELVDKNTMQFQEQQQKWLELNSVRDEEMHIVEKRREQTEAIIKKQQHDMEKMREVIANTSSQIEPLSSMHLYVKMVTSGFTVMKSIFIFFLSMNISWMVTTIPLLRRARRSLYVIFFIGFVIELAVVCLDDDKSLVDAAELIRIYTRVSAVIACVIAFLMACIYPKKDTTAEITMDELLKKQMEIVAMLGTVRQIDSVGTPSITQSPFTADGTTEQSRYRDEGRGDSFIISNPNFRPSRRQRKSSHSPLQPYHKPLRACDSPLLVSKKSAGSEPANGIVNTVTPNSRFPTQHEWDGGRAITSGRGLQHVHHLQSNAESSSDSSDDSSDEDAPVQLVMTKKKRKYEELQTCEPEQGNSSHEHLSKVNETKKKKSKQSSSDSSDDSSNEDEPVGLVITKKKRKHEELQTCEPEQGNSSQKHLSKVNEAKKKKSKFDGVKIY